MPLSLRESLPASCGIPGERGAVDLEAKPRTLRDLERVAPCPAPGFELGHRRIQIGHQVDEHGHVASRSLRDPLAWNNSSVLYGDATRSVARLKLDAKSDIVILGSGELIRSLMPHHLIDEYRLLIHPLVLGEGLRLFSDNAAYLKLRLRSTKTTTTGVIIATYIPL